MTFELELASIAPPTSIRLQNSSRTAAAYSTEMSRVAAPPRTAPARGKSVRTGSRVSGQSSSGDMGKRPATGASSESLKAKEEEYRRLNAELEARTAELVKEAEHLVKGNLSILCDLETSTDATPPPTSGNPQRPSSTPAIAAVTTSSLSLSSRPQTQGSFTTASHPHPSQAHPSQAHTSQTHTKRAGDTRRTKTRRQKPLTQEPAPVVTEPISADVERAVLRAEQNLDAVERNSDTGRVGAGSGYHGNDILPEAAEEMGPEALVRFLKAKLRVMQEEVDRLCQELAAKEKQLTSSQAKVKELSDQNSTLQRTHHTVQSQVERYRALADSMKEKCGGLEAQLTALRKEVEGMKGRQKKAAGQQGALEVRLNRALEEAERYKTELATMRARSEDSSKTGRQRVERLTAENRQLEKQRNDLMAAFKKQMKLIDILKRQKMHIEAAKMLSFTEEEFVKALDWKAT